MYVSWIILQIDSELLIINDIPLTYYSFLVKFYYEDCIALKITLWCTFTDSSAPSHIERYVCCSLNNFRLKWLHKSLTPISLCLMNINSNLPRTLNFWEKKNYSNQLKSFWPEIHFPQQPQCIFSLLTTITANMATF